MSETLLTINNLHKTFGEKVVLDDISLEVHKGEVIVVIGPSGCGKSTFLRCINALEDMYRSSGDNYLEALTMILYY